MRAARALDMLLVLQRRGRTSARELASLLEVSERTVLRDVEVLSEAGVPIYAKQGAGGGIELVDGFETHLTGLTTDEARSLLLVGQERLAHRLGLAAPARRVRAKLMTALPDAIAAEAGSLTEWFVHDPDPGGGSAIPHGELRRIASCIQRRRKVELSFAESSSPLRVQPLGLVLQAGAWLLVTHDGDQPSVLSLNSLRSTRITNVAFSRPDGFDLSDFWDHHRSGSTS